MKRLPLHRILHAALFLGVATVCAQDPVKTDAPRPAADPAMIEREISHFRQRLENLRKEEEAWREKSATEKEMATMHTRIAETEAKLKEWENRKTYGGSPRAAHSTDAPKNAPQVAPAAEALKNLRHAIRNLHAAGKHELAAELAEKAAALDRELHATADQPGAAAGHEAEPFGRFAPHAPAPYPTDAPQPPAAWLQPLEATADARALFEKRILPIFNSARPSSCTECHLSGVELKDYIFSDQEKTFAALLKGQLINPSHPDNSKILEFISRRPEKPGLIGDEVRRQEFEAFRAWIHAAVKDPKVLAAKPADAAAGPDLSAEVIRHARTDRVLASFLENVWVEMNRCASCHSPEKNQRQVEKHGELMSWIKPGDPLGTLRTIVQDELLDLDRPEKSPLLTKPTLEKSHKGGQKMVKGDRSYLQFLTFAEDYAAIARGRYAKGAPVPAPSAEVGRPTQMRLRITDIPERFAKLPLQADIFARTDSGWSKKRVATATWLVSARGGWWQFALTRIAPRGTNETDAVSLKPGRYLIKLYVDQSVKLGRDPRAGLGETELVGEVEVETPWRIAPKDNATVIQFPKTI